MPWRNLIIITAAAACLRRLAPHGALTQREGDARDGEAGAVGEQVDVHHVAVPLQDRLRPRFAAVGRLPDEAVGGDADGAAAAFFEAARAVDGELDGLRERAADLVGRANRRRDQDRTLDDLARSLDALDVDRAPFDRVDAYVRAACRRLEARSDEKKLVGTFVPDPASGS